MSSNATQIVANSAQAYPSIHIENRLIPMSEQPLPQDTEAASLGLGLISFRELCRKDPRQAMQVASSRLATIRKREAIQMNEDAKKARVEDKKADDINKQPVSEKFSYAENSEPQKERSKQRSQAAYAENPEPQKECSKQRSQAAYAENPEPQKECSKQRTPAAYAENPEP